MVVFSVTSDYSGSEILNALQSLDVLLGCVAPYSRAIVKTAEHQCFDDIFQCSVV